jgi:hypothetical protein
MLGLWHWVCEIWCSGRRHCACACACVCVCVCVWNVRRNSVVTYEMAVRNFKVMSDRLTVMRTDEVTLNFVRWCVMCPIIIISVLFFALKMSFDTHRAVRFTSHSRCRPTVWNLIHVTILVPRIWRWLADSFKICWPPGLCKSCLGLLVLPLTFHRSHQGRVFAFATSCSLFSEQ